MQKTGSNLNPLVTRVLIVGGSGRIARLLRQAWRGDAARFGVAPVFQARREGEGADAIFDPLGDAGALARAIAAADVVVDLAGRASAEAAELAVHARMACAILSARGGHTPVIAASSAAVYGRSDAAQSEAGPTDPPSEYGCAKLAMEAVLRGQPATCCLRIGNVAGADALLGRAPPDQGRSLHVFADSRAPYRSYIGPLALARGIARLARLMAAGLPVPGVLNLALPGAVGMEDLLRASGETWRTEPAPDGAIPRVALDVTQAVRLGLVPGAPATAAQIVADLRRVERSGL